MWRNDFRHIIPSLFSGRANSIQRGCRVSNLTRSHFRIAVSDLAGRLRLSLKKARNGIKWY